MMTVARLTCLWPGLPRLWFRGDWAGLAAAAAFAALVNVVLVATLVWPEVAPGALRAVVIGIVVLWWAVAGGLSLRELPYIASGADGDPQQGLFVAGQTEYLRGNWLEAESCVRRLLRRAPRDVEALLLLAAIARRTGRIDEARSQLQALSRLEAAAPWQLEIRTERELLRRAAEQQRLANIQQEEPTIQPPLDDVSIAPAGAASDEEETQARCQSDSHRRAA